MASSHGNMNLREQGSEMERASKKRQRRSNRLEGKYKEDDLPDDESKKPKKKDVRGSKYDSQGIQKKTKIDLCDCLVANCPGCWFPCKKCSSTKCGHECRRNRRWEYENIQISGTNITFKNEFKK